MQSNKSSRFSMTNTPSLECYLQTIWAHFPGLTGCKSDTLLFAASTLAYELSKRGEPTEKTIPQSVEASPNQQEEVSSPFDLIDEIEC